MAMGRRRKWVRQEGLWTPTAALPDLALPKARPSASLREHGKSESQLSDRVCCRGVAEESENWEGGNIAPIYASRAGEVDRIAGAIKATHPDFRYQPIAGRGSVAGGSGTACGRPAAPDYAVHKYLGIPYLGIPGPNRNADHHQDSE